MSNNLRKLRSRLNLTQAALAVRAEVPVASLRFWEQTGSTPRLDAAARVAKALDCPVLQVFPEIPIAKKGQGKELFRRLFAAEIEKLDQVELGRFELGFWCMPDGYFREFLTPFSTRVLGWDEALRTVRSAAAAFACQNRLDELVRELEERRQKAPKGSK